LRGRTGGLAAFLGHWETQSMENARKQAKSKQRRLAQWGRITGAASLMILASSAYAQSGREALQGGISDEVYLDFEKHSIVSLQEVPEFLAPDAGRRSLEGILGNGVFARRKGGQNGGKSGVPFRAEIRATTSAETRSDAARAEPVRTEDEEEGLTPNPRSRSRQSERPVRVGSRDESRSPGRAGNEEDEPKSDLDVAAERIGTVEKIVDSVINIGKKVWAVVEAGEPVYSATYNRANALPESMTHWTQMSDWNPIPRSKIFRFSVVNVYGITTVDFSYRITFVYAGKFDGTGAYLNDVGVETYNLEVLPLYSFDAQAEVSSTSNVGSRENPVAGMRLRVKMVVKTILKHGEYSHEFFIRGDQGSVLNLTNGN